MHSRKRSAALLSDDTTNDDDAFSSTNTSVSTPRLDEDGPSKRLQNLHGAPISQTNPTLQYDASRLLNNLAFTRLYVTANFHAWDPASSPVVLCCVDEQNELYTALWSAAMPTRARCPQPTNQNTPSHLLPTLYQHRPNLQALALTAGYLPPNATPDRTLSRLLPLTTTAGLEASVAEAFERFRRALGPGECIAVVDAAGTCTWTSREVSSVIDMERGLVGTVARWTGSVGDGGGGDVAMPDG